MEPVRDLGGKILSEEIDYICDKANLAELKAVLEVVRDKPLKKIKFVTKHFAALARYDVNTFAKAEQEERDVAFTGYVLERISRFIGGRVKLTLEELDMEGMPIGKWIRSLSFGITNTLKIVSLRHTRLGDTGARKLMESGLSSTVSSLDLTGCYMTREGMKYIYLIISRQQEKRFLDVHFKGLEHICLDYNPIGDEGLIMIVDLLMNDFYMRSIEARSCSIKHIGDALDIVQCNNEIQVLDLRNNNICEGTAVDELIRILIKKHPIDSIKYKWKDPKNLLTNKKIDEKI